MSFRSLRNVGAALLVLACGTAALAETLTEEALIVGLVPKSTVTFVVDPAALSADAAANIGKGVANVPSWAQLAKLTQFLVEINFEYNSVAMVPESYRTLGLLADALHHPLLLKHKFLIVGHTDWTGDAKYNLELSLKRAQAIQEALATTFAVSPKRLFAVGVGEELPLDAANPKAAINRRVQLINIGLVK
jgi:outer membrane protein OmpA-like peptidoglycan-associated protein